MKEYYFSLSMTKDEFFPYYQGRIQAIVVTAENGLKVQFPAMHLRNYITSGGIKGRFCLVTENNKFVSLKKVT